MNLIKKSLILFIGLILVFSTYTFAATDEVQHFVTSEILMNNVYNYAVMSHTLNIFNTLGYNNRTSSYVTISDFSPLDNYIHERGKNYALSYFGHGNRDVLVLNSVGYTSSLVSGNWHLVMLNSCSSGYSSAFADAFNITGRANCGFLGWFNTVTNAAIAEWLENYRKYVGNEPLRTAALDAAADCTYSTPIRFHGDTSWYGWAY